jgi:hypothetical protein
MNDKWINYAIILTIVMFFVNGFILMAAAQPNNNNEFNIILFGSSSSSLSYSNIKDVYGEYSISDSGASSQSPTNEEGYTPIQNSEDQPAGLDVLSAVSIGVAGLELVLLQLANIFYPIAPLFYAIITAAILIKSAVVWYLASVLVRALFGRQI